MYRGRGRGGFNGSGRGGFNNNNNNNPNSNLSRANDFANQNAVTVEIYGWTNATEQDLVSFISRKTHKVLQNVTVDRNTGALRATVRSKQEGQDLEKYSGIRFAGDSLKIKLVDEIGVSGTNTANTMNTIGLLKSFLKSHYDPASKMLNLDSMVSDPTLLSSGLFSTVSTSTKMFPALLKLATNDKYKIESVNLSNNNLGDFTAKYVLDLALMYPNIKNLALSNNNITKLEFLEKSKNKLNNLREIVLTGNPILNQNPHLEIVKTYPKLVVLDGQNVRDENKLNAILTFPFETKSMFFENGEIQKTATGFISTFLNLWDSNRLDLLQLYTADSQFSYHFDSSHIADQSANPVNNSSASTTWGNYINSSRNLTRISGEKSRMQRLCKGPEEIGRMFQSLPKTKHMLMEHPNRFAMEAWSFAPLNGMQVVIHGEFEETGQPEAPQQNQSFSNSSRGGRGGYNRGNTGRNNTNGTLEKRSFDRILIVIPSPNGSFIVASDMLIVKTYAGSNAWAPKALINNINGNNLPSGPSQISGIGSSPSPSAQPGSLPPDVASKLNVQQQQLVTRIMSETRLTLEFTLMLCEQSNWNYEMAGQNFQNSKAQIPPTAFQF